MTTKYTDVAVNDLIDSVAEELKSYKELTPPEWAAYVKTGMSKERVPSRKDWWYVRAAAILRSTEMQGPLGVSKLRTKFGGIKNRGYAPERFYKGSGNIIRTIMQQLEKAGLVKQETKGVHKGRIITSKGVSVLAQGAKKVKKE